MSHPGRLEIPAARPGSAGLEGAGWKLPFWVAVMVQVPPVSGMTVAPETVHAGEGAVTSRAPARKDTASPEVAWADTTNGTPPWRGPAR